MIVGHGLFCEEIPARVDALNLEPLSGPDLIALPQLDGQHDLTLAGDSGVHAGKIASYFGRVKRRKRGRHGIGDLSLGICHCHCPSTIDQ
jgi:hypothetical protein